MIRATTNGVLKGYKNNLMHSFITLNNARDTVLTQRYFNSFSEDPASATQAFQLRRSFLRTSSQYTVSQSTVRQYEASWSALVSVVDAVDNDPTVSSLKDILMGENDPTGSGRAPLGQKLIQFSESITQSMNGKYGDAFLFAGADGLNVPFKWEGDVLKYRDVDVNATVPDVELDNQGNPVPANPANPDIFLLKDGGTISRDDYETQKAEAEKLDYLANETRYVDIGLGLQEDENGNLIESSAFNSALPGINFLGYGTDEDGDPKNIACIIRKMGTILSNCDPDTGEFADGEEEVFKRLGKKFEISAAELKEKHVEMDARSTFLKNNEAQLEATADTLNQQIMGLEQCDLADAITSFSWAQYCYNAALKMGNSILSDSLMDYMK